MGKAMCLLVPFIELTVSHTSVLTILAITVERSESHQYSSSSLCWWSDYWSMQCISSLLYRISPIRAPAPQTMNFNFSDATIKQDMNLSACWPCKSFQKH